MGVEYNGKCVFIRVYIDGYMWSVLAGRSSSDGCDGCVGMCNICLVVWSSRR